MKIREAIQESMVTQLLQLCKKELALSRLPKITLIDDVDAIKSGSKNSFGVFDGEAIKVVTTNRHPIDVLRTLSHELVHWKQRLEKQQMSGEDGSDTENQANAVAGVIMRKFGEKYPEYFINVIP